MRLGINRTWDSRWFASKEYGTLLHEDFKIREYLEERLGKSASVSKIIIERPAKKARVTIYSARPGVIIGKKGADIDKLRADLSKMTDGRSEPQHRRNPQAGYRRQAGRGKHRRSARAPYYFPPRDEARGAIGLAAARSAFVSIAAAVSAAPKSRAWNGIAKAACRCIRCAPMSITAPRPPYDDGHLRRQGLDLPRRNSGARPDGARQARPAKASRKER